jgi:hypothetical protein
MTRLPRPGDAERIADFLQRHLSWSAFWDKRECVWRVAEDDPDSDLYATGQDADTVIGYMSARCGSQAGDLGGGGRGCRAEGLGDGLVDVGPTW